MIAPAHLANVLASAVAAGDWTIEGTEAALRWTLDDPAGTAPRAVAVALHARLSGPYAPPPANIAAAVREAPGFAAMLKRVRGRGRLAPPLDPPRMAPLPPFRDLDLPELATEGDLADWLDLLPATLDRLADSGNRLARAGQGAFRHYACRWVPKASGGRRLIEAPKPRLRDLQRGILRGILDRVPPHPDAFGFTRGRSCLAAAQRHAGEEMVVCLDLADFFVSVPGARVHAIFRSLGYPWGVARLLTGLCTTATPAEVLAELPSDARHRALPFRALSAPHLPQGAHTSPALANLAARRLDTRLAAFAARIGAAYTRYADDLTFSGPRGIAFDEARPLTEAVAEIAAEEGFAPNPAKTRVQPRGGRQVVTGLVVNRHLNIRRDAWDRLKATLVNCRRHGPESQNRDGHPDFHAHLDGRVSWAETVNFRRGIKLRAIFEAIDWP